MIDHGNTYIVVAAHGYDQALCHGVTAVLHSSCVHNAVIGICAAYGGIYDTA